jgi:recombinational DNA repair protein RecT
MLEEKAISLIDRPGTAERFAKIFAAVHGVDLARAAQMFELEAFSFKRKLSESAIVDVTDISRMGVFLDVISNGLSFSGQMNHVYMMTRNVKTGRKENGKDVYEKRLTYSTAPDGKIYMAQKAGSIERVTKPIIVYEGDTWGVQQTEGLATITYQKRQPRSSNKIIAGFVYVIFPDGAREPFWMDADDIERLKAYSAKNNRKWDENSRKYVTGDPNALYSSEHGGIDAGFFGAKLINFALKNIRRAGLQGVYETEDIEYQAIDQPHADQVVDTPSPEFTADEESETF